MPDAEMWRMSAEDAEEYTRSLGQIMSGGWRQIALAQRLGVPEALGMTTDDWVRERIGGYVRLGLDERREAAKELTDPAGEYQLTQRQAAEVLGVGQKTVSRDLQDESHDSLDASPLGEPDDEGESCDSPEEFAEPAPFTMPEEEQESDEERAYYALARLRLIVRHLPNEVADAATHPDAAVPGFEEFETWFSRFMARLRANAATPIRPVQ